MYKYFPKTINRRESYFSFSITKNSGDDFINFPVLLSLKTENKINYLKIKI